MPEFCAASDICGKDQDIVFVLDTSKAFDTNRLRQIIRAIQLMVGALDNDDQGLRVAVVKFPAKEEFKPTESLFIVPLEDTKCTVAAENLDRLSFYLDRFQSAYTNVSVSLEFLSTKIDPENSTTVITVTGGASDGFEEKKTSNKYPLNSIRKAMNMNRFSNAKKVSFYAIGDSTTIKKDRENYFKNELNALSNNITGNKRSISNKNDRGFINETLSFLQDSNILCKKQGI